MNDANKMNTFRVDLCREKLIFVIKSKNEGTTCYAPTGKHGRPYCVRIRCSFWQLETSDPVLEVDKQQRFKCHMDVSVVWP